MSFLKRRLVCYIFPAERMLYMKIDDNCREILDRLETAGFQAFYVGGCVRDTVMGRNISDIDIASDALPEQIISVFKDCKVIPTGLKHGTVTVLSRGVPFEITTFRIDGGYSDSRHPDSVTFSRNIADDLSRRDFTVNALAMDRNGNIIDPFGGEEDIKNKIIRCVGDPVRRFSEDALRIMRAVRFASQLGFQIETETADAVLSMRERLGDISRERIRTELDKLICGKNAVSVLLEYREIIGGIIPEMRQCFGFEQHSRYHRYDVYEHIVRSVGAVPEDQLVLRRALLLHDIGKPCTYKIGEDGHGHFKGHAQAGEKIAGDILRRLKYDNHTIDITCTLIARHSDKIDSERQIKRLISKIGTETFVTLMEMKKADNCAKMDFVLEENVLFDGYIRTARRFEKEKRCMKISQLDVNGRDMLALGLSGAAVGDALRELLELVIDEKLPNEKISLIDYIKENKFR